MASVPNDTWPPPCVAPKFVPVIVTEVPTGPEVGLKLVMVTGVTTKLTPLLANPPAVTTTGPVVAPVGTCTVMFVSVQFVGNEEVPLKVTTSPVTNAPKFVPEINKVLPTAPEFVFSPVIVGVTVNGTALLNAVLTPTITFPVDAPAGTGTTMLVAPQLVGVAVVPLKVTALVPCVAPKFVPVIVTTVPTWPEDGLRLVIFGGGLKLVSEKFAGVATPGTAAATV